MKRQLIALLKLLTLPLALLKLFVFALARLCLLLLDFFLVIGEGSYDYLTESFSERKARIKAERKAEDYYYL